MNTPLNDIAAYNRQFISEFSDVTQRIVSSGQYILGSSVAEFESQVASMLGVRNCVGVASGTDALELVFQELGLCETDEIILPANAYIACALGASRSKAKLCLVDCARDGTLDIDALKRAITPNTRAVLVVHLYGDCCDMERLSKICELRSIRLIEDCAQAFGSKYNGKPLGSFGYASCHSFYPTKNLGALGDAGAICTNDTAFAERLRLIRTLGTSQKYVHTVKGTNARLDALQAAYLSVKLPRLSDAIKRKRELADLYSSLLTCRHVKTLDPDSWSSYHLYVIDAGSKRDALAAHLKESGIETIIHYPIPFYKSAAFHELNHLEFPITEALANTILSLPMHPLLTNADVEKICLRVNAFLQS